MVSLDELENEPVIQHILETTNIYLCTLGAIEHSKRHARHVAKLGSDILARLGYSEEMVNLALVAGYLHDIGNLVNRYNHGRTGAFMGSLLLKRLFNNYEDIAIILGAIGNHEEKTGSAVNPVAAAVIIADKSDVHCSRVRKTDISTFTPRDRVNFAVQMSSVLIDGPSRKILFTLQIDTQICSVMDYFDIFLPKMTMSRRAAEALNCSFSLVINGSKLL